MKLNMDLGTLQFARNGRDLGLAVQGLEGTLYPAFSMYNRYVRAKTPLHVKRFCNVKPNTPSRGPPSIAHCQPSHLVWNKHLT